MHRLAASLALAVAVKDEKPTPAPAPKPDGKACPECAPDGVPLHPGHPGKVGDGTVFMDCPNASCPFKVTALPLSNTSEAPPAKPAPVAKPAPEKPIVYRKVCKDGVCTLVPVQ